MERGGTGKLRGYWKKDIFVVVSSNPDLSIFKSKPKNGSKPIRTVHRNLLLKSNELPFGTSSSYSKQKVLPPQIPSESQTKSESDSDFVLLGKPAKPKGTLPSNSTGREESAGKSDQDTDSGREGRGERKS